ncbi:hypothetical protein JAAARDRAFT_31444 [Jaapia argillacea MUCL 33604]|uniref:Uncharacterized protein n=1 Tax=Jaapia argillacea MUCL 33604 TaxID=933084 RepID=A0A067QEP6_9AGAM|nr:hypothetical protein JAAARDRAFT_31444 [Jaapia argillacea MUCL 33604]
MSSISRNSTTTTKTNGTHFTPKFVSGSHPTRTEPSPRIVDLAASRRGSVCAPLQNSNSQPGANINNRFAVLDTSTYSPPPSPQVAAV